MDDLRFPKAGWKEWAGLATLALPTLIIGLDMTVLHLAVPHLSADIRPTSSQLLWIVDIYGFLIAGFLLTMGTLGDRIGRRRLLVIGAVAFAIASVIAAFSTTPEMLIGSRALLGIAGATLMPSTLSLIRNMFPDSTQRTAAISIWMMSLLTGQAIGPLAGGVMLEYFWWGSVFLLSVPVMVLLLVLAPFLLPEFRDPAPGRLDLSSVALSLLMILTAVYGLKELVRDGMAALPVMSIMFGITIGIVFIRRQQRLTDPMLDLRMFGNRTFSLVVAIHSTTMFLLAGMQFISAQHLQLVLGLSPLNAGMWMVPAAVGGIVGALLASGLVRMLRPAMVIASNLVVGAAGFAALTQVEVSGGLTYLVGGLIIATFAVTLVTALTTDLIVAAAPSERAGTASGISETSAEFGIAMGIAVLGSISTAVYRNRLVDSIPDGVSSEVRVAALDTLGAAVAVSEQLPDSLAVDLLVPAQDAFAQGLALSAAIGAAVMLALAILSAALLRPASAQDSDLASDSGHSPSQHEPEPRMVPAPGIVSSSRRPSGDSAVPGGAHDAN